MVLLLTRIYNLFAHKKTTAQQNYARDYSAMWLSKASKETNWFACCRYSSNSLGTDGKLRELIQKLSISS